MSETAIDSVAALEGVIGKAPGAIQLKVIDHLDAHALAWIQASPVLFAGFGVGDGIAVTIAGGPAGSFATGHDRILELWSHALDDPELAVPGRSFGALFLAPGVGETLRVNGRVAAVADGLIRIAVEECFVHCAKALIRSGFWTAEPVEDAAGGEAAFVDASRFMALATIDAAGGADLSPKGDPAGAMARLDGDVLWFADRPGNRKADSFRNIIAQPAIAAILLAPGSTRVAVLSGRAVLTTGEPERARFTVRDKQPLLAIRVGDLAIRLRHSPALERAALWPAGPRAETIQPAKAFAAHVKLNRDKGFGAKVAGALLSVPGLMQKSLDKDYKSNLY